MPLAKWPVWTVFISLFLSCLFSYSLHVFTTGISGSWKVKAEKVTKLLLMSPQCLKKSNYYSFLEGIFKAC